MPETRNLVPQSITPAARVRLIAYGLVAVAAIAILSGGFFTVAQNEVGAVTRFGQLVSAAPVPPGLHFKIPGVDTAHVITMSVNKLPIDKVQVKTVDNQFVQVDLNLTYKVAEPFKALFQVGEMGASGIHDKVIPFVQSRTLDKFGQVNALEIGDKKQVLEHDILLAVQAQVQELFGELIEDVQITSIKYDDVFEKSIQATVQTRNQQIAAQNILRVKQIEADQAVASAKGQADAAAAQADGQKRVAIAQAEASAASVKLAADAAAYDIQKRAEADAIAKKQVGEAEAEVIATKAKAAGTAGAYADILRAEAAKNWNGSVPQYQFGGGGTGGGVAPVMVLPAEAGRK